MYIRNFNVSIEREHHLIRFLLEFLGNYRKLFLRVNSQSARNEITSYATLPGFSLFAPTRTHTPPV